MTTPYTERSRKRLMNVRSRIANFLSSLSVEERTKGSPKKLWMRYLSENDEWISLSTFYRFFKGGVDVGDKCTCDEDHPACLYCRTKREELLKEYLSRPSLPATLSAQHREYCRILSEHKVKLMTDQYYRKLKRDLKL